MRWLVRPSPVSMWIWPILAAIILIIGAVVPPTFLLARVFGCTIWIMFVLGECASTITRGFLKAEVPNSTQAVSGYWRRLKVVAISAVVSFVAGWLPLNTAVQFWFYHSQLDDLARRIPASPVSYYGFGDTRIGPYIPVIDRYPHWLGIGIGFEAFCPENWEGLHSRHGVYFILEDDPDYKYNNIERIHLQGQWYAGEP